MIKPNFRAMMRIENAFKKAFRQEALLKQKRRCCYCHDIMNHKSATAEHVTPRKQGGTTTRQNIKASCIHCNRAKADMPDRRFKKVIRNPAFDDTIQIKLCFVRLRLNRSIERACDKLVKSDKN